MNIDEAVIGFVAQYLQLNPLGLTPETLINDDLGVDGDDGMEFILEFSEAFDVDMSSIGKTYFGSEGFGVGIFIWPVIVLLNLLGFHKKMFDKVNPLSIQILIESAKQKRWVD